MIDSTNTLELIATKLDMTSVIVVFNFSDDYLVQLFDHMELSREKYAAFNPMSTTGLLTYFLIG